MLALYFEFITRYSPIYGYTLGRFLLTESSVFILYISISIFFFLLSAGSLVQKAICLLTWGLFPFLHDSFSDEYCLTLQCIYRCIYHTAIHTVTFTTMQHIAPHLPQCNTCCHIYHNTIHTATFTTMQYIPSHLPHCNTYRHIYHTVIHTATLATSNKYRYIYHTAIHTATFTTLQCIPPHLPHCNTYIHFIALQSIFFLIKISCRWNWKSLFLWLFCEFPSSWVACIYLLLCIIVLNILLDIITA